MNMLPIATPTAPANGAVATDNPAAAGSGDFAALVAMLVATASTTLPTQRPPVEVGGAGPDCGGAGPESPAAESAPTPAAPAVPVPDAAMPEAAPRAVAAAAGSPVPWTPASAGLEPSNIGMQPPAAPRPSDTDVPGPPASPPGLVDMDVPASPAAASIPPPATGVPPRFAAEHPAASVPAAATALGSALGSAVEGPAGVASAPVEPPKSQRPKTSPPGLAPTGDLSVAAGDGSPDVDAPALDAPLVEQPLAAEAPRRAGPDRAVPAPHSPIPQTPGVPADQPVGRNDVSIAENADGRPAPKITTTVPSSAGSPTPMVPLIAVNRSEALSRADVPPAAPVAPPNVPDQIVSAVVPLHGRGDGRHEVTLELRPDHLGTIRVEVSVEHQTVNLTLHAAEPATSRLLAAALPDLRSALADAGLSAGHLGVGPDGGRGAGQWRNPSGTGEADRGGASAASASAAPHDDSEPVRPVRPAAAGRLDLFL